MVSPPGSAKDGSVRDIETYRNLVALEAIAADSAITQRTLARRLGVALGLANVYVKRLVRKGHIKCVNVRSNRLKYLLTPTGIAEKTRLMVEYMEYSLHLYRDVRAQMRGLLAPLRTAPHRRVAIYGTGEIAELAYLSIKEAGHDVACVFDQRGDRAFLGMPVLPIREQDRATYDLLVVAVLDPPDTVMPELLRHGIPAAKLRSLHPLTASNGDEDVRNRG
jgi:hypothetical protein